MFPVMLCVRGRRCLVVGGGGVALRKVESLLADGAAVTVVAPAPSRPVEDLAARGAVSLERRPYRDGDAAAFALVFAATDDRETNRAVSIDAAAARVWVNVADDPELCSFQLPARVRRGALQLAVASAGEAPFAVRRLRQLLERRFGPEWAEWLEGAARLRRRARTERLAPAEQERLFDRFFAATVDGERLTARVARSEEVEVWLEEVRGEAGRTPGGPATEPSGPGQEPPLRAGLVSLVGAGPGDPGLLGVRGLARLRAAQAVVYDRLAEGVLPCDLDAAVELHCVGKEAGNHPVPQEEINSLLVRLAREGKRVVRLKGGDPFVFGRGGEEAEALDAAGIELEVVPGVTAGIAAPAYAGIPVTHRREAVRVTLLTAHECSKEGGSQVRWELMAADPHATLVGYMGVTALPNVVRRLLQAGMSPATPAALIERGTTSAQRSVASTLAGLPAAVEAAGLGPPALFVIGPTAAHASRLGWYGRRPLVGERLLVAPSAAGLAEGLELAGVEPVRVPLPLTPAARVVMGALPLTGCVVGGAAEVDALDDERGGGGWRGQVRAFCLGARAAARARERGWPLVTESLAAPVEVETLVAAVLASRGRGVAS